MLLHIILAVLKIIGVFLLVLLALAAALLLIVLLVPITYKGRIRKEDVPLKADGTISWLAGLLQVRLHVEGKRGRGEVRILRKSLKTFCFPKEEVDSPAPHSEMGIGPHSEMGIGPQPESGQSGHPTQTGKSAGTGMAAEDRTDSGPEGIRGAPESRVGKILDRLTSLTASVRDLVLKVLEVPSAAADQVDRAADKAEETVRTLQKKAGPFLTGDARACYRRALSYLVQFLHTCRIRRLEGYLLVGTGEPDTTGEAIGLLYLVLPETGGTYDLQADFYGKTFRTDTTLQGSIRLVHGVWLLVRLLLDKEVRFLLRTALRKKGNRKTAGRRRRGSRKR